MKVLTFSKEFPKTHINAGEPTNFKEKILSGEKIHTIRAATKKEVLTCGNYDKKEYKFADCRFKIGDQISMRYWTGKPYNSKQEIFCEDFEVKEIIKFRIKNNSTIGFEINENNIWLDVFNQNEFLQLLSKNDGLTLDQFKSWFKFSNNMEEFFGYIIAWKPTNY